jgi:Skp family chaperone for outer membrane proteins
MRALPLLAVLFALTSLATELKIVTVDVQRLLAEYDLAKEAAKQLREKEVSFQKEIQGLRLEGRRLLTETDELKKSADDNALSAAAREDKRKALEAKLADLRTFEVKYDDLRAQRETELRTLLAQTNKRIVEDVLSATRAIGEKEGANLVLNANRANPLTSDVLHSKGVPDVTDKILASLNKK